MRWYCRSNARGQVATSGARSIRQRPIPRQQTQGPLSQIPVLVDADALREDPVGVVVETRAGDPAQLARVGEKVCQGSLVAVEGLNPENADTAVPYGPADTMGVITILKRVERAVRARGRADPPKPIAAPITKVVARLTAKYFNDGTVQRVDAHTGKLAARIEAPFATSGGAITTGGGRVWANYRGIPVAEIDPATNAFVAKLRGYGIEPNDIAFGGGSIWVAGPLLYRVKLPE